MTTRIYNAYPDKEQIKVLAAELVAPLSFNEVRFLVEGNQSEEIDEKIEKAYAIHYFMSSWYTQIKE